MTPQQMLAQAEKALDRTAISFSMLAYAATWTLLAGVTKYVQGGEHEGACDCSACMQAAQHALDADRRDR